MKKLEKIILIILIAFIIIYLLPFVNEVYKNRNTSKYKKMIDAYGKAIELEINKPNIDLNQKLDLSSFNINSQVLCDEFLINENFKVFLNKCSINGEYILDSKTYDGYYHYGENSVYDYVIGDVIKYNNQMWYVVKNSKRETNYVTLILKDALKYDDVKDLKLPFSLEKYYEYVTIPYFQSDNCNENNLVGCNNSYTNSNIKKLLDIYLKNYYNENELTEDLEGYKIRLVNKVWFYNLGYKDNDNSLSNEAQKIINIGYPYFTMSEVEDNAFMVYAIGKYKVKVYDDLNILVRPVINVLKTSL